MAHVLHDPAEGDNGNYSLAPQVTEQSIHLIGLFHETLIRPYFTHF